FVFTLKDNNQKAFNSFFWFLFFLHLTAASVVIINAKEQQQKTITIGIITLFLFLTAVVFLFKSKFRFYNYQVLMFVLMVIFWPVQSAWLPAIVVAAVIVFAFVVLKTKSAAVFSEQAVAVKRSLFTKEYQWSELENVVLKDNWLSIDLKNNHLIQVEVAAESTAADETAFNGFCRQQLLNP
ncbi:MAG: hypothetical protein ACQUYJ_02205, partial [Ferruginibacter sp.]